MATDSRSKKQEGKTAYLVLVSAENSTLANFVNGSSVQFFIPPALSALQSGKN